MTVAGRIGRHAVGLMTAVLMGAVSCAPVDEVPPPDAEMQGRIARVADLLDAVSNGRAADIEPLVDHLDQLCRFPPAETASRALALALRDGLAGRHIARDSSERLAMHLYNLVNGGYLQRRNLERVTLRMEQDLLAAGVPAMHALQARDAGIRVAREPRNPRADWW